MLESLKPFYRNFVECCQFLQNSSLCPVFCLTAVYCVRDSRRSREVSTSYRTRLSSSCWPTTTLVDVKIQNTRKVCVFETGLLSFWCDYLWDGLPVPISLRGTEIFFLIDVVVTSHPSFSEAASRMCGVLLLHFLYVFMQWWKFCTVIYTSCLAVHASHPPSSIFFPSITKLHFAVGKLVSWFNQLFLLHWSGRWDPESYVNHIF